MAGKNRHLLILDDITSTQHKGVADNLSIAWHFAKRWNKHFTLFHIFPLILKKKVRIDVVPSHGNHQDNHDRHSSKGQVGFYLLLQRFSTDELDQIDQDFSTIRAGIGIKLKIPILMESMAIRDKTAGIPN